GQRHVRAAQCWKLGTTITVSVCSPPKKQHSSSAQQMAITPNYASSATAAGSLNSRFCPSASIFERTTMNGRLRPQFLNLIGMTPVASFGLVVLSSCAQQAPVQSPERQQPKAALAPPKSPVPVVNEQPRVVEIEAVETS